MLLQVVVVSAMGSHESSPIKVTDLLLGMVAKAARQDEAFLLDLAALQVCGYRRLSVAGTSKHSLRHLSAVILCDASSDPVHCVMTACNSKTHA